MFINLVFPNAKGQQGDRARLFTLMDGGKMRGNGQRIRNLFHLESSQVVEQVAPRSCENLVTLKIQLDKTLSNLV